MANYDNARGFWPAHTITPVEYLCKTGETVAIGDAMFPDGSAGGMTIALSNSGVIWNGGVVCPQDNEAGVHISAQGANLYTTSTAAVTVWLYPFIDPDTACPNYFYIQASGTPAVGMENELCDIEGATSAMEANENANTEAVLQIVSLCAGEYVVDSSGRSVLNEVGANGILKVRAVLARAA